MPLDGIMLQSIKQELQVLVGGRVDRVSQPEKDEIIMAIRSGGKNYKLLLTARAQAPRVHFTAVAKQNPPDAPMFCMLLRKHLGGGRIIAVTQPDFERVLELKIESPNEMGDISAKRLVIEIMGKHSNVILVNAENLILDAIKHISPHNNVRAVLPNREYLPPPSQGKTSPYRVAEEEFFALLTSPEKQTLNIQQLLYQSYNGISPVMASEISLRAGIAPDRFVPSLQKQEQLNLYTAFANLYEQVMAGDFEHQIFYENPDIGSAKSDFAALPMKVFAHWQAGDVFESPSAMLEEYYAGKDKSYRLAQKTSDLRKLTSGLIERAAKKHALHQKTLKQISDRDILRKYGEVLTAYIYAVPEKCDNFTTTDFDGTQITIPLDAELTASQNAQKYFKKYNKEKRTYSALQEQLAANLAELAYLESVTASIETASTEEDIAEIRAELAEQGFLKRKFLQTDKNKRGKKEQKNKKSTPLHYVSAEGFDIYVGKNNTQNDEITKKAHPADIWLHTKDIPGSHVILRTEGKDATDAAILEAANLAAYYSKAGKSSQVPVDYTRKKHVKKPAGAKPGFVIYDNHKTVYVSPTEP